MSDFETTPPPDGPHDETPPPADGPHDQTPPPPPPPPPTPPAARPLLRRDSERHVAGVAGGLADHLGVEAAVIRVAFVILAVFGGVGFMLYIVGWLAMPSPSQPQSYIERWFGSAPTPATIIAIAVGLAIVLSIVNDDHDGDGIGWGLALLFAGWLLFRADRHAATAPGGAVLEGPPSPPIGTWHGPGGTAPLHTAPLDAPWQPPPPWEPPPPPRPRSILGRLTLGIALAAVGVGALLDQAGVVDLAAAHYTALALTVTGLGLVAGAWVGRAYGLILAGIVLLGLTFVLSVGPFPLHGGAGDFGYAPSTLAEVEPRYSLGFGELDLDLSDVEFGAVPRTVHVAVGVGETTITVPDDVTVFAAVDMRAGEIVLFGQRYVGEPFRSTINQVDEGTGGGRLELVVDNGVGQVTVLRENEEL